MKSWSGKILLLFVFNRKYLNISQTLYIVVFSFHFNWFLNLHSLSLAEQWVFEWEYKSLERKWTWMNITLRLSHQIPPSQEDERTEQVFALRQSTVGLRTIYTTLHIYGICVYETQGKTKRILWKILYIREKKLLILPP